MELLLVLGILVAVAAASAPALTGAMKRMRLTSAADIVRTQWTKAHVRAMKTGRIQVFRFEVGGNKYSVQPWIGGDDELESDVTSLESMQMAAPVENLPPEETGAEQLLPDGVLFLAGEAAAEGRSLRVEEQVQSLGAGTAAWSAPILFYPDGSASDAYVIVGDEREVGIKLELRGMTGAVKVGEIAGLANIEVGQ